MSLEFGASLSNTGRETCLLKINKRQKKFVKAAQPPSLRKPTPSPVSKVLVTSPSHHCSKHRKSTRGAQSPPGRTPDSPGQLCSPEPESGVGCGSELRAQGPPHSWPQADGRGWAQQPGRRRAWMLGSASGQSQRAEAGGGLGGAWGGGRRRQGCAGGPDGAVQWACPRGARAERRVAPCSCQLRPFLIPAPVWTLRDSPPGVLTMARGVGSRSTDHTWHTVGPCGSEGGRRAATC